MVIAALAAAALATAPPPVSAAPLDLSALVSLRDISSLSVGPDGHSLVFRVDAASLATNRRHLIWWALDLDRPGPARRLTDGGDAIWGGYGTMDDEPSQWSTDGRWIYYRALFDGAVQVWRSNLRGKTRQVTHDAADVERFELDADGRGLHYEVRATRTAIDAEEQRQAESGVRIDPSVDWGQNLFGAALINGRWRAQRLTGTWFSRTGVLGMTAVRGRGIAIDGKGPIQDRAPLGQAPKRADRRLLVRSPQGDEAFVASEAGRDAVNLVDATGRLRSCPPTMCPGRPIALAWRPGRQELVITLRDSALNTRLLVWDVRSGTTRSVGPSDGVLSGGAQPGCAITARWAVCVRSDLRTAPRLSRIDLETGALVDLYNPNRSLDLPADLATEQLTWRSPLGDVLTGQLLRPTRDDPGRLPLFITYYNCPGYPRGGTGDEWPLSAMAAAGMVVVCANQIARPGKPQEQDAFNDSERALAGIRALIDHLDQRGLVDRGRIGMGGLSFGSEQALWIATHSDLISALSISSGQLEPTYYWMNSGPGRTTPATLKRTWKLGRPEETPEAWRRMSPAFNTDQLKAPLLLQLPEQEFRFIPELVARTAAAGTPVELYAFPGEPHIKIQPRHRRAIYERNLDWFRFWLLGQEDPDPTKSDQYARWRSLQSARP